MKNKIIISLLCLLSILIVLLILVYLGYSEIKKENYNYKKDNSVLHKKLINYDFKTTILSLNLMHYNLKYFKEGLYTTAGVYFSEIDDKKNDYLISFDKNHTICKLWTKNSKKQYLKGINNNKFYDNILKGLNSVDTFCSIGEIED